ncbi:YitT family protein [Echinimonas agarilytica]|uniref:YitT family protein n=1 Tax=Echinimonas agarilytica TaxID=1215918 RepID=A0AA41W4V1_9GAMM|nr:YitT family protein [Echinimonas agarilytica]MCM2678482.1 YitT family protein [Echinimonas agarilytica]
MKQVALQWYAQVEGCFLVSLGICFLAASGLLVGGTAGFAFIAHKFMPVSFGFWFFIINLPFFYLAIRQMGKAFAVRSLICIVAVSLMSDVLNYYVSFDALPPLLGAVIAGGLIGIGLILLFRYRSSLGGVNILGLYLEERFNIHSGKVLLASDVLVACCALTLYEIDKVAYSLLGFVVLSSVLGRYHKKAPIQQQANKAKKSDAQHASVSPVSETAITDS